MSEPPPPYALEAALAPPMIPGIPHPSVFAVEPRDRPRRFYVVAAGEDIGFFFDWEETKALVDGIPDNRYKSFRQWDKALAYYTHEYIKGRVRYISRPATNGAGARIPGTPGNSALNPYPVSSAHSTPVAPARIQPASTPGHVLAAQDNIHTVSTPGRTIDNPYYVSSTHPTPAAGDVTRPIYIIEDSDDEDFNTVRVTTLPAARAASDHSADPRVESSESPSPVPTPALGPPPAPPVIRAITETPTRRNSAHVSTTPTFHTRTTHAVRLGPTPPADRVLFPPTAQQPGSGMSDACREKINRWFAAKEATEAATPLASGPSTPLRRSRSVAVTPVPHVNLTVNVNVNVSHSPAQALHTTVIIPDPAPLSTDQALDLFAEFADAVPPSSPIDDDIGQGLTDNDLDRIYELPFRTPSPLFRVDGRPVFF